MNYPLLPQHRQALANRGLCDATVTAAAIWSVTDPQQAAMLVGSSLPTIPTPAMVIEYYGAPNYRRLRPDQPRRDRQHQLIEYEAPTETAARLYVPTAPELLDDATRPLLLVASELEALACMQTGEAVVATGGIWGFHDIDHREKSGRWRLHPEFANIPLAGRSVFIIFCASSALGLEAFTAEAFAAKLLKEAGASVHITRLPPPDAAAYLSVDQYLARGGDHAAQALDGLVRGAYPADPLARVQALGAAVPSRAQVARALLEDHSFLAALHVADSVTRDLVFKSLSSLGLRRTAFDDILKGFRKALAGKAEQEDHESDEVSYKIVDHKTFSVGDEGQLVPVAECAIRIEEELRIDTGDGERDARFRVSVSSPSISRQTVTLTPSELEDPDRLVALLESFVGRHIRVLPGKERSLIDAVHATSKPLQRSVFGHTGWVMLPNGKRAFALPGGSTSADGPVDVEVEIDVPGLRGYGFPSGQLDPADAFGAIFDMLNAGAAAVTVPTTAQSLAAPLIPHLGRRRPLVHESGYSGVFKTVWAVQERRLFGPSAEAPLSSWVSTANGLEREMHLAKDIPSFIDDYKSEMVPSEVWLRVIQTYGDGASRSRLTRNLRQARSMNPRGLVTMAGEEVPHGHRSAIGRLLVVQVDKGWIEPAALLRVQGDPRLPMAGRAWVEAIARSWDWLAEHAEEEILGWRDRFRARLSTAHARTPDGLAVHMFTLERFFAFAGEVGTVDYDAWCSVAFESLLTVGRHTAGLTTTAAPGRRFMEVLAAMLRAGEASLSTIGPSSDGGWLAMGPRVGWLAGAEVWLEPDIAYNVIEQYLRRSARSLSINKDGLVDALDAEGFLSGREKDHRTVRRALPDGRRVRVLELRAADLGIGGGGDREDHERPDEAQPGPPSGPRFYS